MKNSIRLGAYCGQVLRAQVLWITGSEDEE